MFVCYPDPWKEGHTTQPETNVHLYFSDEGSSLSIFAPSCAGIHTQKLQDSLWNLYKLNSKVQSLSKQRFYKL